MAERVDAGRPGRRWLTWTPVLVRATAGIRFPLLVFAVGRVLPGHPRQLGVERPEAVFLVVRTKVITPLCLFRVIRRPSG